MKTTKIGRKFCAFLPRSAFALVLLALCAALTFTACENPMYKEFVGYPKLTVTAPQFSEVVAGGYASTPRQIVILNVGKRTGYIKSVTVSPDTAFTIGSGSKTVDAYKNITDWTVQPKTGLGVNTYTATITVTYEGSNTGTERSTASVEFVVTSPTTPPPTIAPMLTVTAPTFAPLGGGYTPTAGNIIINNTGTAAATGISVTVSPATAFTIGGSGSTVNAGSQITGWTVQPKSGLGVGTYMALISVTYNGGAAVALVSFEVTVPRFVAVANLSNRAAFSADGINWTATTLPSTASWSAVTYGGGMYVALASGFTSDTAAYSHDGINWTAATMPFTASWISVAYGNGMFVAVGATTQAKAAYSYDGISWAETTLARPSGSSSWASVTYGGGKFVALASSVRDVASSANGITWTVNATAMPSASSWYSVTYSNGRFVAVALNTTATAYSANGTSWTAGETMPASATWASVTYGFDKFVAVAYGRNAAAYSASGTGSWTSSATMPAANWYSVTYGNGRFVAVGTNCVAYSANGTNWTAGTMPSNANWSAVTCNGLSH